MPASELPRGRKRLTSCAIAVVVLRCRRGGWRTAGAVPTLEEGNGTRSDGLRAGHGGAPSGNDIKQTASHGGAGVDRLMLLCSIWAGAEAEHSNSNREGVEGRGVLFKKE